MTKERETIIAYNQPVVRFAGNTWIQVPVILQVGDRPLVRVSPKTRLMLEEEVMLHHQDGTDLGRLKGGHLYLTEAGKKANVRLHHKSEVIAVTLDQQTLCELRKPNPRDLHITAELYSPRGVLLRASPDSMIKTFLTGQEVPLAIGGMLLIDNIIQGADIGVWISDDGKRGAVGVRGRPPLDSIEK